MLPLLQLLPCLVYVPRRRASLSLDDVVAVVVVVVRWPLISILYTVYYCNAYDDTSYFEQTTP